MDKKRVKVKKVETKQSLLLCVEGERGDEDIFVSSNMDHLFPEDELIVYGEKGKSGSFKAMYVREIFNDFWLAKWLKIKRRWSNKEIVRFLTKRNDVRINEELEKMRKTRKILMFLQKNGIPLETLLVIERDHRFTLANITNDPYLLLTYQGIGYELVKKVIKHFGLDNEGRAKSKYLIKNTIVEGKSNGHFYLTRKELDHKLSEHHVQVKRALVDEDIVIVEDRYYLNEMYEIENEICKEVLSRIKNVEVQGVEEDIARWEKEQGFKLADSQQKAVEMVLKEKFSIVTGGPGVGKTTVCKCITDLLMDEYEILVLAPTGRAAKRASESTGLPAKTIHSALEYDGVSFFRNRNHNIEVDALVIDEFSMVDGELMRALLSATPKDAKIIVIGDVDQLPSVGAGEVLRDLIESNVVPVTRLTEVFRQAADSPIIQCAYAVNSGKLPEFVDHEDLKYINKEKESDAMKEVVTIAKQLYQERGNFNVQVLIPMHDGELGLTNMNKTLQSLVNNQEKMVMNNHGEIRLKDKVMVTSNDKRKGVSNGDVGEVMHITNKGVVVRFQDGGKEVFFGRGELDKLQLSYAISIHRSQGSEYPCVVMPIMNSYGRMNQKNLIYTGVTRAKKKLWLVYQKDAFIKSVSEDSVPKRNTTLAALLKQQKKFEGR